MQRHQYRPTPSPEFLAHFVPASFSDHGDDLPDLDILDNSPSDYDLAPYVAMAGEE